VSGHYQNGDIPIFYHRLNNGAPFGVNIMDSRGNLVAVPGQITYRDDPSAAVTTVNINLGGGRGTDFFAQSPLQSRVGTQLGDLTNNLNQRVNTLVGQILQQLGLAHAGGDVQAVLQ